MSVPINFLDFSVGYVSSFNIFFRRRKTGKVGHPHKLTKEDAMKWFQTKYDGVILNAKK